MRFLCVFAIVSALALPLCRGGELRLADASGGACSGIFVRMAMDIAADGKTEVKLSRQMPSKALAALKEDKFDAVIVEKRFAADLPQMPFAAEALTLYLSEVNPARGLSPQQVKDILTAPHPLWQKYNGLNLDIQRIVMKPLAPSGNLIRRVLGNIELPESVFQVDTMTSGFSFINTASIFFANFTAIPPQGIKALPVDGVLPTSATVANGKYPFAMRYVIAYRKKSPELQKLFAMFHKEQTRKAISDLGFIVMLPPDTTEENK